jgi:hypothetical protein
MSNEITAYFKGRAGVAESVYQHDTGRVLVLDGLELPSTFEAHFTTLSEEEALAVIGQDNRVAIPNSCLAIPGVVTVYIPLHSGENDEETEFVVRFGVIRRPKADYREYEGYASDFESALKRLLSMADNPKKVNSPLDESGHVYNGVSGQLLRTKGNGLTEWCDVGTPTDEQTAEALSNWLEDHPEAVSTVEDGSLTVNKFSNTLKHQAIKEYSTPEMFGAVGDQVEDDTYAMQACLDYGLENHIPVLMAKKYLVTEPLEITGANRLIIINDIYYTGETCAFEVHGLTYSDIRISKIYTSVADGIHFFSADSDDWSQYDNFYIDSIHAKDYCIRADVVDYQGWVNEIRINNPQLSTNNSQGVGVYINGHNVNGWRLYNCGLEGLHIGVESNGNNNEISIMTPRANEHFDYILKSRSTQGVTSFLVTLQTMNIGPGKFDIDTHVGGMIICAAYSDDGMNIGSNYMMESGVVMPLEKAPISVGITEGMTSLDISNVFSKYVTLINVARTQHADIYLTNLYGGVGRINKFSVRVKGSTADLTIYDHNGDAIFTDENMISHSVYDFEYNYFDGWIWSVRFLEGDSNLKRHTDVDLSELTLYGCTAVAGGYKRVGDIVIVNATVHVTSTNAAIDGFPVFTAPAALAVTSSSGHARLLAVAPSLQMWDVTADTDVTVSVVYIAED